MEKKRLFKKTDLIIIVVVVILAAAVALYLYFGREPGAVAVVYYQEKEVMRIDLTKDKIYELDGDLHVTLEVKDKMIRFIHAECPDKICENTGFIHIEDQTAVCMPAKVSVTIH